MLEGSKIMQKSELHDNKMKSNGDRADCLETVAAKECAATDKKSCMYSS